ncbi:SulP family inorganic anion transporter [Ilumatobacter nonamiensis]|uniref:SulP family inorganic anion transporter n=1 Tax=Ilumatobacter nonamiensis TaxID=467093 RepID=UPI00034C0A7D|nr:SulP family inorganic anion transporter [Ilumatobacter nonamiensis]
MGIRSLIRSRYPDIKRANTRDDAMAGLVLGVESVPDGLANGLLAGVNPVAGLYGYLYGMVGAAFFTSASFMAVQATGAMAIIVADVDLAGRDDPARSLFTLSIVTGIVMVVAGLLKLGTVLRFVSKAVMTGFITAVGLNIILGQLDNFTGYDAAGANRVSRALDLVTHLWKIDLATTAVGVATIALIVVLQRTALGSLGLVVAVVVGSGIAAVFDALGSDVLVVRDIADVPRALPFITMPVFGEMFGFLLPAASLAFVGLVQGAGISAGIPNADGSFSDGSTDFVGQGAGNIAAGLFQGMPVGGSMSASSLVIAAGARSRLALIIAGGVMAVVILAFGGLVNYVAMPALAGLLIVVGYGTIKPHQVISVAKTGSVQLTVMTTTLVLTMLIPLQYAVLVGVGIATILHVVRQSTGLTTRQIEITDDGRMREIDPVAVVPPASAIVLQPYGSVFFATAAALEEQMPDVTPESRNSVVILRIRGADEIGATLSEVLGRYMRALNDVDSKLMVVTDNPRIRRQLDATGALRSLDDQNLYIGTEWLGETVKRAYVDALAWIEQTSATAPSDASATTDEEDATDADEV